MQSLQRRLDVLLFARGELILCDHAGAGIPAKNGIIISRRANGFGFLEPMHGLAEAFVGLMVAARGPTRQLRFGPALS